MKKANNISECIGILAAQDLPTFYQWSGYVNDVEEFRNCNFLIKEIQGIKLFVCSMDNGVGLCDYLSNYCIKQQFVWDLESIVSPGYDWWFFLAWERCEQHFDELPDWCQGIVQLFIDESIIIMVQLDNNETAFAFIDYQRYEKEGIPENIIEKTEAICKAAAIESIEEYIDESENDSETDLLDIEKYCSKWGICEWGKSVYMSVLDQRNQSNN